MDMTGNRTLSMAAGMLGSGVTAHGLNKIDQKSFKSNNISEYNKVVKDTAVKADIELSADTVNIPPVDENKSKRMCSQLGDIEGGRGEEYSSFLKNGIKERFTPIELEGIQKAKEQGALNKVDYNEIYSLREKDYFRRKSLDEMKFKDDGDAAGGGSESGTSIKPNQVHHFATNKSKKYTSQFQSITKKYGLDLDGNWNKQSMPHQGRHPYAYHDYVLDNMQKFDRIANGDKTKFLKLYDQMKQKIVNNPEMLYKDYWNK